MRWAAVLLLLCAVCATVHGAPKSSGSAKEVILLMPTIATLDEAVPMDGSAQLLALLVDKKFLRQLRVEELIDELRHSLSLTDHFSIALSKRWDAAFPELLRRLQELWLASGAIHDRYFPMISDLWDDYIQDVGMSLQQAIDDQFQELAAAKGRTIRPAESPTEPELRAAKRTLAFINQLAELAMEELSAAADALEGGKAVNYARNLVLAFVSALDQVENLHGTLECRRWLSETVSQVNASVWQSAKSKEGRKLTVDVRDMRTILIAALEDTVLGKTLKSFRFYWWFKRHYWWRGSVTPSRHDPDMERLATTLVADRFVMAVQANENDITEAVLKAFDLGWLEMRVLSPVLSVINPDSLSVFAPLYPDPVVLANQTSVARTPCLEAWVEQNVQFYNSSCDSLRHMKRGRYWLSSHSLASTMLAVSLAVSFAAALACCSPCICCCLCCYGCYRTPLLMLSLFVLSFLWVMYSIWKLLMW